MTRLPETRSVKRPSQPLPVSGLPSLVEPQISAMCASTSFVFALGPRYCTLTVAMLHVDLREIFDSIRSFKIYGKWSIQASKQASKHRYTRAQCSHASVGLAEARPNYILCSILCGHTVMDHLLVVPTIYHICNLSVWPQHNL